MGSNARAQDNNQVHRRCAVIISYYHRLILFFFLMDPPPPKFSPLPLPAALPIWRRSGSSEPLLFPAPAGKVGAQHAAPPTSLLRHLRCCYGICGVVTASAVL